MNWDDSFAANSYEPANRPDIARCEQHPGHAVFRYGDGTDRCTSGHVVEKASSLPKVRDDIDRVGELLAKDTP